MIRTTVRMEDCIHQELKRLSFELDISINEIIVDAIIKEITYENNKEVSKVDLTNIYKEWRKHTEEDITDGLGGSVDCGEAAVRSDFSRYAELEEEISFEVMLQLERSY